MTLRMKRSSDNGPKSIVFCCSVRRTCANRQRITKIVALFGELSGEESYEHSGYGHQVTRTARGPTHMNTSMTTDLTDICRADQAYLAALVTSVSLSRLLVRGVCSCWQLDEACTGIAELIVSELAANAVQANGVTEPQPVNKPMYAELKLIGVRLLELHDSLVIEVWDTSPQPPMLLEPDEALEHGRGLQVVDALSIRWGYYDAHVGGKVVWCQLALDDTANVNGTDDAATFQQIEKALQAHLWDEQA
jgi:hypothetical protein